MEKINTTNRVRDLWEDMARRMNLQLFAEDGESAGGDGGGEGEKGNAGDRKAGEKQEKTLTQAEVDALIEKRLARAQRDQEKRLSEARAAGVKEGEERARMSEAERLKADREQAERDAGEREEALRQREAETRRRELRADAVETLAEKGLPRELGDLLDYTDADTCKASIGTVEKVFRAAVQAGIDERIRKSGGSVGAGGSQRADTSKMTDAEYYATLGKK